MNKTLLFSFILLFGVAFAATYLNSCQTITSPGEYIINSSANLTNPTANAYCFKIKSNGVTLRGDGNQAVIYSDGFIMLDYFYNNTLIENINAKVYSNYRYILDFEGGAYNLTFRNNTIFFNTSDSYPNLFLNINTKPAYVYNNTFGCLEDTFLYQGLSFNTDLYFYNNTVTCPVKEYFTTGMFKLDGASSDVAIIENNTLNLYPIAYAGSSTDIFVIGTQLNRTHNYTRFVNNKIITDIEYYFAYMNNTTVYFNTSKILENNIVGGVFIGGNYWGKPDGTGFSQTCSDADLDGICDNYYDLPGYQLSSNLYDYLPLADPPISITLTNPENNSSLSYLDYFNWTYSSSNAYECNITIDGTEYYAGENSTSYQAPNQANAVGKHTWNVTCWDSSTTTESETREYYILEKTITLTNPENNSYYQTQPNYFNWTTSNFIEPYNCNITINGVEYEAGENSTSYQNTLSNDEGTYTWYVKCWDNYDENTSETYQYSIDTTAPQITNLFLTYTNDTVDKFTIYCEVNESNIKEVWINLTSNDSYNHSGSVNATGNFDGTYYYADFLWTQEEGVLYNYSCYVEDLVGLSAYDEGNYSTMNASPSSTDYWANYTFSNVYISITSPKEQDTIPFKQYYLTFTIDQDFATPREAICKFYISYDLDYTDKTEIFSKTYTLDNSHTEIREPINTELSFLDYVGNYQRDTPSQQKVFIVCGLDNGYAGYTSTEYYVHLPSTLTLILLLISFLFVIISFIAFIYSDYGIVFSLLSMVLLLISVFSAASDGVAGSWYLSEVIIIGYILSNVSFILGFFKLSLESYAEYKEGL